MSDWQPIETAPKNTFVLLYLPWNKMVRQGRFVMARGRQSGWRVSFGSDDRESIIYGGLTHWQPLPAPPTVKGQ